MAILEVQQAELRTIPGGAAGVAATLDEMVALTQQWRTHPLIRRVAERIIENVPAKDYRAEAGAVQDFVRGHVRYTMDVRDVETLKTPLLVLESQSGDCDDMSLLAGTLLESIGHPVRYVAVGDTMPGEYTHVFPETRIGTRWIAVETTEPVELGWVPFDSRSRMVRHV